MSRLARPLSALAAVAVVASALACSGLQDAAVDAAVEAIENSPADRADFEKTVKDAVVQVCLESAGSKAKKKMDKVCRCAADTVIRDKSVKELYQWSQDFQSPAVQKEMAKVIKSCRKG